VGDGIRVGNGDGGPLVSVGRRSTSSVGWLVVSIGGSMEGIGGSLEGINVDGPEDGG
jgi:hypothetical protein